MISKFQLQCVFHLALFFACALQAEEPVPAVELQKARSATGAEAIKLYRVLSQSYPRSATVWYELGEANYDAKDWQEALQAYQRAEKLGWKPATIHTRIGKCLEKLKRYAEAEAAFRKAIEVDSKAVAAQFGLGVALHYQSKTAEAAVLFEELAKREDSWGEVAREYLAQADYDLGRYDAAIQLVETLLAKNAKDSSLHWLAGRAYYKKKSYAEALKHFEFVAQNDPKRAEAARYYRAASLEGLGRTREAESAYREVGRNETIWGEAARKEAGRFSGKPYRFLLDYLGGYDTNVIRNSPDSSPAGVADGFNQVYANAEGRVLRTQELQIWLGADHYGLHYFELHQNDYIQDAAKIAFNMKLGPFKNVWARYQLNYSELNGDPYRRENFFESGAYYEKGKDRLAFSLYYSDNTYFGEFGGVGGTETGGMIDYRHSLPCREHELRLRLNAEFRLSHDEIEQRNVERVRLQYRTLIIPNLYGQIEGQYRRAEYPHSKEFTDDGDTLPRRTDNRWSGEIQFDWHVQKHLSINWGYLYEHQESTRALERYSRQQWSAGFTLQF